jgi:type II secretory pathway component PulJ
MRPAASCRSSFHRHPVQAVSGFTLIELVISGALASLILTSAYVCLNAGVKSQKMIEPRSEVLQNARVAMALLTGDLRSACPLSDESAFVGLDRELEGELENIVAAGNIDFATHNYTPRRPREGDYCQVSYFLARPGRDPLYQLSQSQRQQTARENQTNSTDSMDALQQPVTLSLYRRRNPFIAADAFAGGTREEILRGVRGLQFEYYDGEEWRDTWGQTERDLKFSGQSRREKEEDAAGTGGLPVAVRITLYLDPDPSRKKSPDMDQTVELAQSPDSTNYIVRPTLEPPMVLQTVVRLELSDRFPSTSSSQSSATNLDMVAAPEPEMNRRSERRLDRPSDRRSGDRRGNGRQRGSRRGGQSQ